MQYFPTASTLEVDNYPYGRMRTTARFGTEFKKKMGFRNTLQTLNPKTGKWNKVKLSNYAELMIMRQDDDGKVGHSKMHSFSGREAMTTALRMIETHWDLFTTEERQHFGKCLTAHLKMDAMTTIRYCNADRDQIQILYTDALKNAVKMFKDGMFYPISLDWDAIEALKEPGYNPFTITTQIIG